MSAGHRSFGQTSKCYLGTNIFDEYENIFRTKVLTGNQNVGVGPQNVNPIN